jgi:hypothetical protein
MHLQVAITTTGMSYGDNTYANASRRFFVDIAFGLFLFYPTGVFGSLFKSTIDVAGAQLVQR